MSIRNKIIFNLFTMTVVTVVACIIIYLQLLKVESHYNQTLEENLPQTYEMAYFERTIYSITNELYYYITGDESALVELRKMEREVNERFTAFSEVVAGEEKTKYYKRMQNEYAAMMEGINKAVDTYKASGQESAIPVINSNVKPKLFQFVRDTASLNELIDEEFNAAEVKAAALLDQSRLMAIIISVLAYILGTVVIITLVKRIAMPLKHLEKSAEQIASGDLTGEPIVMKTKDEIAHVANAFNTMKDQLHKLIRSVVDNAENLSGSAEELSASSMEITNTSLAVADQVDHSAKNMMTSSQVARDSSVAMNETATAVQRIAESAQELNESATATSGVAASGRVKIESAETQMSTIYESTKLTTELIQKLSEQSDEIENISKVITSIAAQTNLLALNAAIEAARAGEHGKGFAVVADEVRKLAEESSRSASQIVSLTTEIKQDTKDVENAVMASLANVEDGVEAIATAGSSFQEITGAVLKMREQIEDISAITEQISAATEEVAASVTQVVSAAEQNAIEVEQTKESINQQVSTLQEISAITFDLSDRAIQLRNEVNRFKI